MKRLVCLWGIFLCGLLGCILSGCSKESTIEEKENLKFIVISEECLPKELLDLMLEEKEESFKVTYTDEDYLYICRGYGAKPSGGYSVTVEQLYQTKNAIYVKTSLIGPSKEDQKNEVTSYPYIVMRVEKSEESVVFDS